MADREGLDLLGIQDHPYAGGLADTFAVIATVLAETERLRVFPDVASLPLRGPAVLGKQAATLDLLSGGGSSWRWGRGLSGLPSGPWVGRFGRIRSVAGARGGDRDYSGQVAARREGESRRSALRGAGGAVGACARASGGIWFGSVGPKANALTGRIADGWAAPIPHFCRMRNGKRHRTLSRLPPSTRDESRGISCEWRSSSERSPRLRGR